ncbi:MAG: TIM barrel protein [Lentisphaeria bacterium]|jgi:sugar phosphate isomerase/epimerase|nr:TIM barrel protein [Lentisphaeria bacterium]MDY0176922.1 TIM barrel protein [Lentisphaeria bacterium]
MEKLNLGISISSVSPRMNWQLIKLLAESEIRTFELNAYMFSEDFDGALANAFMKALRSKGKRVNSYHIPFTPLDDISAIDESVRLRAMARFRAQIRTARFFEAELLVVHPSTEPIEQDKRHLHMTQLRKSLLELEPELRLEGLRLTLENLPRLCMGNSVTELKTMLAGLNPLFGACLDVNHLMSHWQNLPAYVEDLGQLLYTLHISDYDGVDEKHWLPGQGVIDWKNFLLALRKNNYQGTFNYEVKINHELDLPGRLEEINDNFASLCALGGFPLVP